jgi:HTH-type transcriptional regulator/antitoxin HigA
VEAALRRPAAALGLARLRSLSKDAGWLALTIGQSGRVSEVLNRKRALSLRMVKRLHDGLRIPYESLLAGVR